MGVLGPNPMAIALAGIDVVITWPAGTLQEADDVTGPYTDVGAGSPLRTRQVRRRSSIASGCSDRTT